MLQQFLFIFNLYILEYMHNFKAKFHFMVAIGYFMKLISYIGLVQKLKKIDLKLGLDPTRIQVAKEIDSRKHICKKISESGSRSRSWVHDKKLFRILILFFPFYLSSICFGSLGPYGPNCKFLTLFLYIQDLVTSDAPNKVQFRPFL